MGKYSNLRFFNGTSGELGFRYDETTEMWDGIIYVPKVSVGLYETVNLFVLEEVRKDLGGFEYIKPISENSNANKFLFEVEDNIDYVGDVFLYSVSLNNGFYSVEVDSYQTEDILPENTSSSTYTHLNYNTTTGVPNTGNNYKLISAIVSPEALHCKIALKSEEEKIHIKLLKIYEYDDNGNRTHLIATIKIYGETVGEDERLTTLLSNLGMSFKDEDFLIFKSSDVNEFKLDHQLLNKKKKELLLEGHNIKPYLGSYKAITNAIKYYGYNNIKLKEYWLNINEQSENFGKLKAVAVPDQNVPGYLIKKNREIELPNSNLKKTSRFSLVYKLNEPDGGVDEWDIPTVKESFDFTPEEVLIKLYGLKKRLQKDYLPLQAKIVDITAEGDFFTQFNQNVWNDQQTIQVQKSGTEVDFEIFPNRRLFIEDLRLVSSTLADAVQSLGFDFNENISTEYISGQDSYTIFPIAQEDDEIEKVINFYETYYNQELNTFTTLTNVPVGCPIVLNCTSLTDTWDSCAFTWNDADLAANDYTGIASSIYTWNTLWKKDVYEAEWVIKGEDWSYSHRDTIENNKNLLVVIPRSGTYEVILNLYDLYNTRSYVRKNNIVVNNKSVEVYGMYTFKPEIDQWNLHDLSWNLSGGYYNQPQESYNEMDEFKASWYLTLDRANYTHDTSNGVDFSTVSRYVDSGSPTGFSETTGPFFWKNLKQQVWDDGYGITWESTRIGADITSSFLMEIDQAGGYVNTEGLEIVYYDNENGINVTDQYTIQSAYPINNSDISVYLTIQDELNSLDPIAHPILSKFKYNAILIDNDGDGVEDSCTFILAVGKEYSSTYDFVSVQFPTNTGGSISNPINYKAYNPKWNDTIFFGDHANISLMQHITLIYDATNMPGIVKQEWNVTNNTTGTNIYYEGQVFTYLFHERGDYTVNLTLTDTNGNVNSVNRNMITITEPLKARPKKKPKYQYTTA
jgi:hypothetical protein